MALAKSAESSIRNLALDPLCNFRHESIPVAEWGNATVIVRAMSAGDWLDYRSRAEQLVREARVKAGLPALVDDEEVSTTIDFPSSSLYSLVLVRTLYEGAGTRVFEDDDIDLVIQAFSPVHDRLVSKAFELSGVEAGSEPADPVDTAGND